MSKQLTWLHLSDLHICSTRTGWDARRVLKSLQTDLRQMEQQHGLTPDFLFFTGDAAFGQIGNAAGEKISDQFQEAQTFLESVRNSFATPILPTNVFIVPGNHDVNRNDVLQSQTEWLDRQQNPADVIELLQSDNREWKLYMERLAAYRDFLSANDYHHLLTDPTRLIYAVEREIKGVKVGIYGLNSAWSCGRNGERGKLWTGGKWQIGHLKSQLEDVDIAIALIHHPGGWFVEYEEPTLSLEIERAFHFHLHGHEHLGWIDQKASGHARIAASAIYQGTDYENGYSFVRLNLETGEGEVWLRRYDTHGGGWIPRTIYSKTDNEGRWTLQQMPWAKAASLPNLPQAARTSPLNDIGHVNAPSPMLRLDATQFVHSSEARNVIQTLKIFLCHGKEDKPAIRKLYRLLQQDGFAPWLDEENLLPGQEWQREITKAVKSSDVFLVCLSQDSASRTGFVQREIKQALDVAEEKPEGTIFIIPLRLEECTVPERLNKWHWVNYYEEKGYEKLIRTLQSRLKELPQTANYPT